MEKSLPSLRSSEENQLNSMSKIKLRALLFLQRKNQKTKCFGNEQIASLFALFGRKSVEFNVENQLASFVLSEKEKNKKLVIKVIILLESF